MIAREITGPTELRPPAFMPPWLTNELLAVLFPEVTLTVSDATVGFRPTDAGDANRMVARHGRTLRYCPGNPKPELPAQTALLQSHRQPHVLDRPGLLKCPPLV